MNFKNSCQFFPSGIFSENLKYSISLIKKILDKRHAFSFKSLTHTSMLFGFLSPPPSQYPFLKSYFQQLIVERTDICVSEMSSYLIQGRRREREVRLPALHRLTVADV